MDQNAGLRPELTTFPRVKTAHCNSGTVSAAAGFFLKGTLFQQLDPTCVRGLVIDEGGVPVLMHVEAMPEEHYHLSISGDGAVIAAADERGALQALRTLAYLASRGPLQLGEITDGPDLAVRAYHLDLKDQLTSREYTFELIDRLAAMRYNTIVVEYEDKFPYSEDIRPRAPECWSEKDVAEFTEYCRVRGIEVIPLIQSLGHLEFLTPFHKELAESNSQLCPSKPQSAELVMRMADEVLSLHPGARLLHIGGDEAMNLGACPVCRDTAEEEGKGVLYGRHMQNVITNVLNRNVRPMIWADMVLSHPDALDLIDRSTVMVDWDYWSYGEKVDMTAGIPNEAWEDFPEEKKKLFAEYADAGAGDCWSKGFPSTEMLRERGYDVITASALRAWADPYTHPDWKRHLPNVWAAARTAVEDGALGSLITSWAVRHVLPELTMMGIAAGAEAMWQARIADARWLVDFPARFGEVFLGDRAAGMAEYELSVRGLGYDETLLGVNGRNGKAGEWMPNPRADRIKQRVPSYPKLDRTTMSARMALLDRGAEALKRAHPNEQGRIHVELYTLVADEAILKLWIFRVLARLEKHPEDATARTMARHLHAELIELKERASEAWRHDLSPAALEVELKLRFDEEDVLLKQALRQG